MNNSFPPGPFGPGPFGAGRGGSDRDGSGHDDEVHDGPRSYGPGRGRPFGAGPFGTGRGPEGLWQMIEQFRGQFDKRVGAPRKSRGDVRQAILVLLAEKPRHGYEVIREIESRSGGAWKPSPGSVYPTLQMIADEGLVKVEESGDRKIYVLTDEGQTEAEKATVPWNEDEEKSEPRMPSLFKSAADLAHAVSQATHTGSPEQVDEVTEILRDARRKINSILAED